jgi:hypothetical protein
MRKSPPKGWSKPEYVVVYYKGRTPSPKPTKHSSKYQAVRAALAFVDSFCLGKVFRRGINNGYEAVINGYSVAQAMFRQVGMAKPHKCHCDPHQYTCCDVCTGTAKAKADGTYKDKR